MPTCPKIPLPDQVQVIVDRIGEINQESVSPLVQRLNVLVLTLSVIAIIGGRNVSDYLVFAPNNIVNMQDKYTEKPESTATNGTQSTPIPYVWTAFTSILVEESILFLLCYFVLINFIVYKNRVSFESAWETKDFYKMLLLTSVCSLAT